MQSRESRGLRRARRTAAITAIAVLAVGAAGCGKDSEPESGGAPAPGAGRAPSATVETGLMKGKVLPLQAFMVGYPSRLVVQQSKVRVQRECMKSLGFEFAPPQPGSYPPPNFDGANMARRYGVSVPAEAEKFGYHLANDIGEPPLFEPGPAAGVALKGRGPNGEKPADPRIPEGGCLGESDRKVGNLDETLVNQLNGDSFERSQSDPAVLQALAAWSSCMKGKGYTAASPLTVNEQLKNRGSRTVSPEEIATAVADVDCKQESDLTRTWFEVETRIQNDLIGGNQLALTEARDANALVVKAASGVG